MASAGVVKGLLGKSAITHAVSGKTKGFIFFLHGTCDSGKGMKHWISQVLNREFRFNNYKVVYPSSPIRPYRLMDGQNAAVWYDRLCLGPELPEDQLSIDAVGKELDTLIQDEQSHLETANKPKVIIGGFSMGGSLALHLGYRINPNIAGVFALSSFLPPDSSVFASLEALTKENRQFEADNLQRNVITKDGHIRDKPKSTVSKKKLPKLFMSHGERDPLVKANWSKATFDELRSYGTEGHFYTFPRQSHEITKMQLNILHNWIEETLSDTPKPMIQEPKPYHLNDDIAIPLPYKWPTK